MSHELQGYEQFAVLTLVFVLGVVVCWVIEIEEFVTPKLPNPGGLN